MKRRRALAGLAALSLASSQVPAQVAGRMARLGFLSGASRQSVGGDLRSILLEALARLGHVEGRTMQWFERYAENDFPRLDALAGELALAQVDVILTQTTPATQAAARVAGMAVVSVTSGDLVGAGLAKSLARPGGNVTGLSFLGPELAVKQVELLKEVVPRMRRPALLATRDVQPEVLFLRELRKVAPAMALEVVSVELARGASMRQAFAEIGRHRADALLAAPSVFNRPDWRDVVELALAARLPLMFATAEGADAGGLMAYGINRREFYARAAGFVDRILKGAKPADLPIEQPTRFELVVNRRTAALLGLQLPQAILLRADRVIE